MSIKIMSAIFESDRLAPTPRLIMLALADHADDKGRCYPSLRRLCQRTGLSERAIQSNIRKLVDDGYIEVIQGGGKSNTNVYFVRPNPAEDAPRSRCTPAADAPQTPQQMRPNPAADAPEPSRTIIKPSEEPPFGPPTPKLPPKARLPDDWALSDEGWAYARSKNIPDEVIEDEAKGFHAYWSDRTDAGGRKSAWGWEQCWNAWCRRIAPRYIRQSGISPRGSFAGRDQQPSGLVGAAMRSRAARSI